MLAAAVRPRPHPLAPGGKPFLRKGMPFQIWVTFTGGRGGQRRATKRCKLLQVLCDSA